MYNCYNFLLDTGCRFSDLNRLRFRQWRRGDNTVTFTKLKQKGSVYIPLTSYATGALEWAEAQATARTDKKGDDLRDVLAFPVDYQALGDRFQAVLKAFKIYEEGMGFHLLRHTCASRLVQRGIDLYVVQKWIGHKNISTTQRYARQHPHNLRNAMKALEE